MAAGDFADSVFPSEAELPEDTPSSWARLAGRCEDSAFTSCHTQLYSARADLKRLRIPTPDFFSVENLEGTKRKKNQMFKKLSIKSGLF